MLHINLMENHIKFLRKAHDLTQKELADKVGVGQGVISSWEKGKNTPNSKYIPRLAKALKTSEASLWGKHESTVKIPILSWEEAGKLKSIDLLEGMLSKDRETTTIDSDANGKFALVAEGQSMNQMIFEGATIVINGNDRALKDGQIYVFCKISSGETIIRIFKSHPTRLEPYSTDKGYETIRITSPRPNDEWQVIGRLIEIHISFE